MHGQGTALQQQQCMEPPPSASCRLPPLPSLLSAQCRHAPPLLPALLALQPALAAERLTFDELQGLSYLDVKGSGIAHMCPTVRWAQLGLPVGAWPAGGWACGCARGALLRSRPMLADSAVPGQHI